MNFGENGARAGALALVLSGAACMSIPADSMFSRMPRDVRTGLVDMAIERVEADVAREEVALAVQALVERETLCFPFPGVWLDASDRRNIFVVRFDLMARDWGEEVTQSSAVRMQEFVDLGFLDARTREEVGPGVVEYSLTPVGAGFLRGSPYGGERPSFCAPSERRVVELSNLEWGDFACGSLRVSFAHVADAWPSWARTTAAQERVAAAWGPLNVAGPGTVSLGRLWYRHGQIPSDMRQNGELRSLCVDQSRGQIVGEDLEMSPGPR